METTTMSITLHGNREVRNPWNFNDLYFVYSWQIELSRRPFNARIDEADNETPEEEAKIKWRINDSRVWEIIQLHWKGKDYPQDAMRGIKVEALAKADIDLMGMAREHLKEYVIPNYLELIADQLGGDLLEFYTSTITLPEEEPDNPELEGAMRRLDLPHTPINDCVGKLFLQLLQMDLDEPGEEMAAINAIQKLQSDLIDHYYQGLKTN